MASSADHGFRRRIRGVVTASVALFLCCAYLSRTFVEFTKADGRTSRTICGAAAAPQKSVAKETLARLRSRIKDKTAAKGPAPTGARMVPPTPDPWTIDDEGRRIYPWPKSFAEIVQTAAYSAMELLLAGETRVEVDFPPLPLADLDWNNCDTSETRVVDSNIQHAIAFAKFLVKDPRKYPVLDPATAAKNAAAGAEPEQPDQIKSLLERRFPKKKEGELAGARAVRIIFPNKPDMLRARDIHYDKWKKMERPELLRRGYYNEVNDDTWEGPFEDVYIFIIPQESGELPKIRNYIEKADAIALRQGRVLRHVLFNCNLHKMKNDIKYFKTIVPFRPGLATPKVHFDFLCTFRNAYLIRFGKYTMTVLRDPFNVEYIGALYHAYPGPWQIFMQGDDGKYRTFDVHEKRPSVMGMKRRLQRAFGLLKDAGLPEEIERDDVYRPVDTKLAGTIQKPLEQVNREGFGDFMWFEDGFDEEISDKWRL